MRGHMWVELKMTPVEVEEMPDGTLNLSVAEAAEEIAHEEAQYGCWICFTPLDRNNLGTDCLGGFGPRDVPYEPAPDQAEEGPADGSHGGPGPDLGS